MKIKAGTKYIDKYTGLRYTATGSFKLREGLPPTVELRLTSPYGEKDRFKIVDTQELSSCFVRELEKRGTIYCGGLKDKDRFSDSCFWL